MIIETGNIDKYASFIDGISNDRDFSDPHFSYDADNLYLAPQKKDQKIFISTENGEVNGLFVWLIIPEEEFAELMIGFSRSREAWETMIDYIETNYSMTQIDFVYNPNNKVLTDILKSKNVTFDVPQVKLCLSDFVPYSFGIDVSELKPEHEKQYVDLHETDTYWTSEKVLGAKDRFRVITAVDNGEVVGYLDITKCYRENEIYDLRTKTGYEKYRKDLLAKAIQLNRPNGIMAQLDIDDTAGIELFKEIGFEERENSQSVLAVYKVK